MNWMRNAAWVTAGIMAISLGGCASEPPSPAAGASDGAARKLVVGYSVAIAREPTFVAMINTVEKYVEEAGGTVYVADANFNPNQQISDVDSLVARGVNVLLVAPIDPNGLAPALARAREKKIPIIVQEAKSNDGEFFANVITDNFEAAEEAGQYLAANGGGPAVALQGQQVADLLVARKDGFDRGAAAAGLQVLDTQYMTMNTDAEARALTDQWRQRLGTEVKGIFAWNTLAAVGVTSALTPDFSPKVVSVNGNPAEVELVRSGRLLATWSVVPVEFAKLLVHLAKLAAERAPSPALNIHIRMPRIDKSNVDRWVPWEEQINTPPAVSFEFRGDRLYLRTTQL